MVPLASKWTNLALALVAIAGLLVAVVPIGGPGTEEAGAGPAAEGTPAAASATARLVDALGSSAAVQGVSSPKPPLPALRGGGHVAFNHRGDRVASEACRGVVLWDTATWTVATTIHVEGSRDLVFSPDDRYLYVGGGGREPIFARYDTTTGRRDRDYAGRQSGLYSMVLSRDGRTITGQSLREREVLFHDTDSGEILKRPRLPGCSMKPAPDGNGVLTCGAHEGWHLEPFRGGPGAALAIDGLEAPPSTSSTIATCDDPDLLVLVNREVEPGLWDEPGSLTLCRRTGDAWAVVKEVRLETARSLENARLSKNGRLLAAAGRGNIVRVYTVPDLRERGQVRFAVSRGSDLTVENLAFSPDGGWLVVGTHAPLPGLVRIPTDAGEPLAKVFPWIGHGDSVASARFTGDGTHVLTRGVDQTVCLWDARTLEMVKRYDLPEGFEAVAEADPWILCVPDGWPGRQEDEGWPLKVVDAERGDVLYETRLPPGFGPDRARRMPDGTLLLVAEDGKRLCRFDCTRAAIVSTIATTARIWPQSGELSKDRLSLRIPPWLGKGDFRAGFTRIDLRTGEVVERKAPHESWVPARACGFVPGERYLFSAGEELILYAEDTLKVIARRPFSSRWPMLAWTRDGTRHALRVEREAMSDAIRSRIPPDAVAVVSVHETLTGSPLFAVPLATDAAHLLLDAKGGRLIVVGEDGRLTRWTLPAPTK